MPALFDKLGITFQYPENWQLDEADALEGRRSVTVYSPSGGAFWSVSVHPRNAEPVDLAAEAVKAMRQEYEDVDSEAVKEMVSEGELVGYDLNFFYLDLTNTAVVRCVRMPHGTYTIFYQAEDHDFKDLKAVFHAMTISLLRSVGTKRPRLG